MSASRLIWEHTTAVAEMGMITIIIIIVIIILSHMIALNRFISMDYKTYSNSLHVIAFERYWK